MGKESVQMRKHIAQERKELDKNLNDLQRQFTVVQVALVERAKPYLLGGLAVAAALVALLKLRSDKRQIAI